MKRDLAAEAEDELQRYKRNKRDTNMYDDADKELKRYKRGKRDVSVDAAEEELKRYKRGKRDVDIEAAEDELKRYKRNKRDTYPADEQELKRYKRNKRDVEAKNEGAEISHQKKRNIRAKVKKDHPLHHKRGLCICFIVGWPVAQKRPIKDI